MSGWKRVLSVSLLSLLMAGTHGASRFSALPCQAFLCLFRQNKTLGVQGMSPVRASSCLYSSCVSSISPLVNSLFMIHRGGSSEPPPLYAEKRRSRFGIFGFSSNNTSPASESVSEPSPEPTKESPKEKRRRENQQKNETETETKPAQEKKKQTPKQQKEKQSPPAQQAPGNTSNVEKLPRTSMSIEAPPQTYQIVRTQPGLARPGPTNTEKSFIAIEVLTRLFFRIIFLTWTWGHIFGHEKIVPVQRFAWERLNDRYTRDSSILQSVVDQPPHGVGKARWALLRNWRVLQRDQPKQLPLSRTFNRTVVVVPLSSKNDKLDLGFLRDVVSFLVKEFRARTFGVGRSDRQPLPLEVVLLVSSPGGSVSHYGLAAAQVQRLAEEDGIALTVCVDTVAASGGYMIASQADKLVAAPFASVGSVGVLMETLNFHEFTRLYGIRPISLKSGKHKNTLSTFGPISSGDEKHETERLNSVHRAFQELVIASRPALAKRKDILEGQVYFGTEALDLDLIDEVLTSDEYILNCIAAGDRVLRLQPAKPRASSQKGAIRITPLDLLPYLRTWVSNNVTPERMASIFLTIGPWVGFATHLFRQYIDGTTPPYGP